MKDKTIDYCSKEDNNLTLSGKSYGTPFELTLKPDSTVEEFFIMCLHAYRILGYCNAVDISIHTPQFHKLKSTVTTLYHSRDSILEIVTDNT